MMKGCWKVSKVDVAEKIKGRAPRSQRNAYYRFRTSGLNHAGGSLAPNEPELFNWLVPDIETEQYDLMDAEFTEEAAALAAEVHGLDFLHRRARRCIADHDPRTLEDTQEIPRQVFEGIAIHPPRGESPRRPKPEPNPIIPFNEPPTKFSK